MCKGAPDVYKEKLRHFLEGLEMQNIDSLMDETPVRLKLIGSVMANRIKDLKLAVPQQVYTSGHTCHCADNQGGPCSSCMEAKHGL